MVNVLPFLTRRPQTKRELAERMGIPEPTVGCGYCDRAFRSERGRSIHVSDAHPTEWAAEGAATGKGAHREYMRQRQQEWRDRHPDRARETTRRWAAAHPDLDKARQADYRQRNREHRRDYQAAWRAENREHVLEYAAERRLTGRHVAASPEARRRAVERQRAREVANGSLLARLAVKAAVRRGDLIRRPCEVCGAARVHGHHFAGYAPEHRLDVQWLCPEHHREAHNPDGVARRRRVAARLHRRSTHVHETASALDATAARMRTEAAARLEPSGTLWGQP